MKKFSVILAVVCLAIVAPTLLYGVTLYRDLLIIASAIQTSTIDSTVIGATTPAAAAFTSSRVSGNTSPGAQSGAWKMWNLTGSGLTGETDFINQRGSGNGGFLWYNATNTGILGSPMMSLDSNGTLSTAGNFNTVFAKMSAAQIASTGSSATAGLYLMWNLNSSNEGDFFNVRTSGNGGFDWYNGTPNSPGAAIMLLSNTGVLTVNSVAATSVVAQGFSGPLTGNASTATQFASTPAQCPANSISTGISANGTANCISEPNTFSWIRAAQGPPVNPAATQGAYIGWSMGGIGETDFVNSKGSGAGGWNWIDATSNTVVAFMDTAGDLRVASINIGVGSIMAGDGFYSGTVSANRLQSHNIQSGQSAGCTTASSSYATCTARVNWPTPYTGLYSATCNMLTAFGFPSIYNTQTDSSGVTITIGNGTSAGAVASGGSVSCIAHQN